MSSAPEWDLAQLRALAATVAEGTLEAAARSLHVTPSAVSQRLRALEVATGRVLLVRSRPVRPTASGRVLLRLARQVQLLADDAAAELAGEDGEDGGDRDGARGSRRPVPLPIAVNADSLATWVLPALAAVPGVVPDVRREDQERTAALLRAGTVVAAVSADADAVPGCSATRLGRMRYRPMAAAGLAERHFADGATPAALSQAPVVVFDRDDALQHRYLDGRLGGHPHPPVTYVPSSADFLAAVRLGMGWGMLPDLQSRPLERAGELVELDPSGADDVVLHWQQWKLRSPVLDRVAQAVRAAAAEHLLP